MIAKSCIGHAQTKLFGFDKKPGKNAWQCMG